MNFRGLGGGIVLLIGGTLGVQAQSLGTWYDAYEAGLSAQAKGQHAQALAAFQRAAGLRPQPGNRILTYGLNSLETYHPYLRSAQSALALGLVDVAEEQLKRSAQLGKEPAAERERLLQQVAALRAAQKPAPQVVAPPKPEPAPQPVAPPAQAQPQQVPPPAVTQPAPGAANPAPQPAGTAKPPASAPLANAKPTPSQAPAPTQPAAQAQPQPLPPAPVPSAPEAAPAPAPGVAPVAEGAKQGARGPWIGGLLGGMAVLLGAFGIARRRKPPVKAPPIPEGADHTLALPRTQSGMAATGGNSSEVTQQGQMKVGRYTLQRVLGKGACGTTYMGVKDENGLEVAIKVPHPHMMEDGEFMARFRLEAELGARLVHPKIVRIIDPGPAEGTPWLAMELVKGETLDTLVKREAPFPLGRTLDLAMDITEAITYAHAKGVVHRDLKPANIMVSGNGAQVLDFGIARLTEGVGMTATQVFIGTPLYASPESVSHSKVGPAADRYALGCMLFEFLTGKPPFLGPNTFATLQMQLSSPLPDLNALRPGLPPRLVRLVERLTDKKPDQRPEDGEVLMILKEIRADLG